ncbi:hypothetical protein BGX28_000592 [Mortierella sp. GBA30]|nr:hypothetical protein BGX28_000592 [Mortierella sp. GBA30]
MTPQARFLWVSSSFEDCLGYEPDEVLGKEAYDYVVKDDVPDSRATHQESVFNDMVASQIIVRYRHKDGRPVTTLIVFSFCYEFIVNCATVLDVDDKSFWNHSTAMTRIVEPKEQAHTWDPNGLEPEPRVCMILNRFSRALAVLYASPSCEFILHIDAEEIIGKPFLLFIRADDLTSFVEQVDLAKSTDAITHMRFWFQSPTWPQEIPCEAILFGSSDGLVIVMRRCRPFVRKRLIGGIELYERSRTNARSSVDSKASRYSWTTPPSSVAPSSPTSSVSMREHRRTSTTSMHARNASKKVIVGSIKRIIELDGDDQLKPMIPLQEDRPDVVEETSTLMKGLRVKEHIVNCDSEDDVLVDEDDSDAISDEIEPEGDI